MTDRISRLNAALEGRYAIEREVGEGGMATVYLAKDLKHNRNVALKVLKPELAAVVGAERFVTEIETTANLQHPHILPLFDSGEADRFLFYVMPFVEGETLQDRIDRDKQLPVDEAVRIASAVANALDHAHRNKVVHRDIKPANILLQDGEPVVADFGIALAVGVSGGRLTETGLSLGTPYYMSPEQATGDQFVGAATDIYALGAVLHEMLTGDPPYTGSTAQAVLGQIIQGEAVSATKKRGSVPANVDAAIRCALEKLPADRFTSAQEFVRALGDPHFRYGELEGAGIAGAAVGPWNRLTLVGWGLAALATLAFGWSTFSPGAAPTPPPISRQVISVAPGLPLVASQTYPDVAISPDGQNIVYQSGTGPGQLAIRALDQLESMTIRGPSEAFSPFLSPDGEWVGFQAGAAGALQKVSILGGPPQPISSPPQSLVGASWGPDDMIVFGMNDGEGLRQVPAAGGELRSLTVADGPTNHVLPDVLPNGAGVLFVMSTLSTATTDDQIAVLDLRTGEHHVIIAAGTSPRYASSGHIVYVVGNTLRAVAFDPERLEVTSDPVPVVEGVMVKANGTASFSMSQTGSLVYVNGAAAATGLRTAVWVNRDGTEEALPLPPRPYQNPRLSPDGRHLAVCVPDDEGVVSLWVYDVTSAAGSKLTQEGATNTPVWTSDGRLVFASDAAGGPFQIHTVMADASASPEHLLTSEAIVGDYPTSVSPDGRHLIFIRIVAGLHREIFQVPLEGDPMPEPLLQGEFSRGNAEVSPNGRWLVYRSDQSGPMEVYVQPYPGPGRTVPVSIGGGTSVTWSPDGTELIYRLDDRMMVASVNEDGETPRIGRPTELFRGEYVAAVTTNGSRQYHVAPDGRFLMLKDVASESPGGELPPQVVLVQNWFEELRERVPN